MAAKPVYGPVRPPKWHRGPTNELHNAAGSGCVPHTAALLSGEKEFSHYGTGHGCCAQHTTGASAGEIDIDEGDETGMTPLIYAVQGGYPRVVRMLLEAGANVAVEADTRYTALHACAVTGRQDVAQMLIDAGANLDSWNEDGMTPLLFAASDGKLAVAKVFIAAGANVDARAANGETALLSAAHRGHVDMVKLLLAAKANPRLGTTNTRADGFKWICLPLDAASESGHESVVKELLNLGLKACGGPSGGRDALWMAAQDDRVGVLAMLRDVGVVDMGKAIIVAAGFGREASVRFLLKQERATTQRGYANTRDENGRTVFYRAAWGAYPRIGRWLLDAGADETLASVVQPFLGYDMRFEDTALNLVLRSLDARRYRFEPATDDQMLRLQAFRRLLLQMDAVRAISWPWPSSPPSIPHAVSGGTVATSKPDKLMLPTKWKRTGGRRVLVAQLFRW
ncbi:unnamed protein product, partial [Ectocarpus fasciculatus]